MFGDCSESPLCSKMQGEAQTRTVVLNFNPDAVQVGNGGDKA